MGLGPLTYILHTFDKTMHDHSRKISDKYDTEHLQESKYRSSVSPQIPLPCTVKYLTSTTIHTLA